MKSLTMKFGGTSVGSVEALERLVDIVRWAKQEQADHVTIVVSAMSGVTDMLQAGILGAAAGDRWGHHTIGKALHEKHRAVLKALIDAEFDDLMSEIDDLIDRYIRFCDSVGVLGEVTPRALDYTMGLGERMSARQVAAVLRAAGIDSESLDADSLVVTDEGHQSAIPDLEATHENVAHLLLPVLEAGKVPVVTGFIGATTTGVSTTLGRGGSDYSAAILGASLKSDEVWIWTDVDGVMSTDPRLAPEARTIDKLTYREVSELAYFGAKVLHPKTIRPVLEAGIPIRVKNTFNMRGKGTLIVNENPDSTHPIKAVTAVKDLGLITVAGKGMLGVPGIAARTFGAVAATGTSVLLISQSSSEQSICFMIPRANAQQVRQALEAEFAEEIARRDIDSITAAEPLTIITVVGEGMLNTPGVAAQVFKAVGEAQINVLVISHGSSDCSLSFAVSAEEGEGAVQAIHPLTLNDHE